MLMLGFSSDDYAILFPLDSVTVVTNAPSHLKSISQRTFIPCKWIQTSILSNMLGVFLFFVVVIVVVFFFFVIFQYILFLYNYAYKMFNNKRIKVWKKVPLLKN